jgi:hypothetical protein
MLTLILVDQRHDWPTNGAALAILQYAHQSLSNSELLLKLEEVQAYQIVVDFVRECRNKETKRHLFEASAFIEMAR